MSATVAKLVQKRETEKAFQFANIKDLKPGQVIWECGGGRNIRLTVTGNPEWFDLPGKVGWGVEAAANNGAPVTLFCGAGTHGMGPRLYPKPVYTETFD